MDSSNHSNVPTSWKEFNDALAAGEEIDVLLGLEDDSIDSKPDTKGNAFDEQFKVTIGGEDFKLNVVVPNIDDVTMRNKDGNEEKLSLSVPPPMIPVNVLLPLKKFDTNQQTG